MRMIVIAIIAVFLFGCATAHKTNRINVGMSKQEAINIMGKPVNVSAKEGVEYLNYQLAETASDDWNGTYTPYFVRIKDGKVDSFGKLDDFNSIYYPDMRIKTEENIKELAEYKEQFLLTINQNFGTPDKALMSLGRPTERTEGDKIFILQYSWIECDCSAILSYDKKTKELVDWNIMPCLYHGIERFCITETE
jgi:hypothetical protein